MLRYAVVEIKGKQYIVFPKEQLIVNYLSDAKDLNCDKVLLLAEEKDIKVGKPYLKETLKFKVEGEIRGKKIRVATYHAKANTRKVKGSRQKYSALILS